MYSGLKSTTLALALMLLALGLTACAKYPVVSGMSAPTASSAPTPPPAR
jgi:hypothetical protein